MAVRLGDTEAHAEDEITVTNKIKGMARNRKLKLHMISLVHWLNFLQTRLNPQRSHSGTEASFSPVNGEKAHSFGAMPKPLTHGIKTPSKFDGFGINL